MAINATGGNNGTWSSHRLSHRIYSYILNHINTSICCKDVNKVFDDIWINFVTKIRLFFVYALICSVSLSLFHNVMSTVLNTWHKFIIAAQMWTGGICDLPEDKTCLPFNSCLQSRDPGLHHLKDSWNHHRNHRLDSLNTDRDVHKLPGVCTSSEQCWLTLVVGPINCNYNINCSWSEERGLSVWLIPQDIKKVKEKNKEKSGGQWES